MSPRHRIRRCDMILQHHMGVGEVRRRRGIVYSIQCAASKVDVGTRSWRCCRELIAGTPCLALISQFEQTHSDFSNKATSRVNLTIPESSHIMLFHRQPQLTVVVRAKPNV